MSAPPGEPETLTFAFGDLERSLFGMARVQAGGEPRRAAGLVAVFSGAEQLASASESAPLAGAGRWSDVRVAGLELTRAGDHAPWELAFHPPRGGPGGFALSFAEVAAPAVFAEGGPTGSLEHREAQERLCRVRGTVEVDGRSLELDCLGQCGRALGAPPWDELELIREVDGWYEDGESVAVRCVRPRGAEDHEHERIEGFVLGEETQAIEEPRLSTTYDRDAHPRRAGLELWLHADSDFPRRLAGEALCAGTIELDGLRLELAFLEWRSEGQRGAGRYEILRRSTS